MKTEFLRLANVTAGLVITLCLSFFHQVDTRSTSEFRA